MFLLQMIYHCLILINISIYHIIAQICLSDSDCSSGFRCLIEYGKKSGMCSKIGSRMQSSYQQSSSFYCESDSDCVSDELCLPSENRIWSCKKKTSVLTCLSDMNCSHGQSCTLLSNGWRICQATRGKSTTKSSDNIKTVERNIQQCNRDSDCTESMQCVDYFGIKQCRIPIRSFGTSEFCKSTENCGVGEICMYSPTVTNNVCVLSGVIKPTGSNVLTKNNGVVGITISEPGIALTSIDEPSNHANLHPNSIENQNSTSETIKTVYAVMRDAQEVPKKSVIDPAALPCEVDYQCRMGESCSGIVQLVDRNLTVCQYDVTKENRMCIYHADCVQGQQCLRNATGTFVCAASMEAALGTVPCFYDYECSGGEKCVNIGAHDKKLCTQIFRCRQSEVVDSRHNQFCRSNAECPYQQVCRHVSGMSLCVDVAATTDPQAMTAIQRKVVQFVQALLFSRA